jgi:predicted hotdog family 3-hydroxylacyl-ACP dehydratase
MCGGALVVFNGIIDGEKLLSLIPHRGKMLLLSRVVAFDTEKRTLRAEYDIDSYSLFFDKSLSAIPSYIAFELIAQSICALSGICAQEKRNAPKPGVILSVSNLEIEQNYLDGTLTIDVVENCQLDEIYTFDGIVSSQGKKAVSAKLTVMNVDDISKLIDFKGNKNES